MAVKLISTFSREKKRRFTDQLQRIKSISERSELQSSNVCKSVQTDPSNVITVVDEVAVTVINKIDP